MSFIETFSRHFDHPPPFQVPGAAVDKETWITTDLTKVGEGLFELLGPTEFGKLDCPSFFLSAIRGEPPTITFFLMVIDHGRYFYFREQVRDVFNANASPENCYASLVRVYGIFRSRPESSFKMVYNHGTITVNNKTLGK